jgi:DNA-directed RNA polymerase specialized sigma24 family protein
MLNQLSERDRTLLILFELERLPGSEVSAILGLSEPNLWVALSRARARFKKTFAHRYPTFDAAEGVRHGH